MEHTPLPEVTTHPALRPSPGQPPYTVSLATQPVDSSERFLYHKTTHRACYSAHTQHLPDKQDVLLWNERGEITESTIANVVAQRGESFITPPQSAGLLAGTFRERLLKDGLIVEETMKRDELDAYDALYLINSVRGWQRVKIQSKVAGDPPTLLWREQ